MEIKIEKLSEGFQMCKWQNIFTNWIYFTTSRIATIKKITFEIAILFASFIQGLLEFIWTEGCSDRSSNPGPALNILVL